MRFVSWLLRCVGLVLLAAAAVLAVGDIARSLAAQRAELMSVGEARAIVRAVGEDAEAGTAPVDPASSGVFSGEGRGGTLLAVVDTQPASAMLGLGGAVLLVLGRRPRPAVRGEGR